MKARDIILEMTTCGAIGTATVPTTLVVPNFQIHKAKRIAMSRGKVRGSRKVSPTPIGKGLEGTGQPWGEEPAHAQLSDEQVRNIEMGLVSDAPELNGDDNWFVKSVEFDPQTKMCLAFLMNDATKRTQALEFRPDWSATHAPWPTDIQPQSYNSSHQAQQIYSWSPEQSSSTSEHH